MLFWESGIFWKSDMSAYITVYITSVYIYLSSAELEHSV